MGRFDDLLNTATRPQPLGGFNDLLGTSGGSRFDDLIQPPKQEAGIFKRTIKTLGGAAGALGRALLVPQQATTGLIEKGLEKVGVLKPETEGLGVKKAIQEQKSNIELLRRVGREKGGGFLTGQYTPSTSVFGNFVKELPVTMVGTLADIFVDPLNIIPVAKISKLAGGAIKEGAEVLAKEIPAVQKIGNMLGKAFITRFGQRQEFQTLDI